MDWTDRHCRYFHRLLAPSATLYTEMVTAMALAHGDVDTLLAFDASEHPVVLQVGGSDPLMMRNAALLAEQFGYDGVNINVGCPSERVQSGSFGACLMAEPALVAACYQRMQEAVSIPVTVKTRIGIDAKDSDAFLAKFVETLVAAGCHHFDIHARVAILKGLRPKQNRSVPPLQYDRVYRLKQANPNLVIVMNGGIETVDAAIRHLEIVDGVMIGREAYHNPWSLTHFEQLVNPHSPAPNRTQVVHTMVSYAERQMAEGEQLKHITRHLLGLFAGLPGARQWRRMLSEHSHKPETTPDLLHDALAARDYVAA